MINIKDFKLGQTAYRMSEKRDKNWGICITPVIVKSVGKKYVRIDNNGEEAYQSEGYFPDGLVESKDWGYRAHLFPTKEAVDRFVEKRDLLDWFRSNFFNLTDYQLRMRYSLEALKVAKEALITDA